MRTRFRDGGLYYMGGKYGMGGMYPQFNNAGQFNGNGNGDPKKIKSANTNNVDFNSGDDTVKSTRTYTEGPTTGGFTDYAPVPAYRRAFQRKAGGSGRIVAQGGEDDAKNMKQVSATTALLQSLNEDKIQTRLVDEEGNEIKTREDFDNFAEKRRAQLRQDLLDGKRSAKDYQTQIEFLDGQAIAFPDYTQSEGDRAATENLFGNVTRYKDPEAHVREVLDRESHWFNPNDPKFGPGGFNVHNRGHVMEYQMMFNQLAEPGKEVAVDGKWGEQTDSARVPIKKSEKEELDGGVDPDLEMRLYQEKPSGGWDEETTGGGGSRGGGYGGYNPGGRRTKSNRDANKKCTGNKCGAYGYGRPYEDGGITKLKTRFKDGGVYYMR